nr:serine/threonine-protein phosphatase [Prevotella sp.]
LKNKEMELENATIQLQNATLDSKTQELKLREANLLMEAELRAKQQRRMTRHFFYVLGGVVMASLVFFLWRRQKQMKKLSAMHEQLLEAYDQLEETTSAKERIESELRIARDIKMSMVPNEFPHRPDLDLAAYMKPAKEVGGDLYSFIIIGETLYFCIGDVSGKGVPTSLFMAQTTRLFRSQAILQQTPEQIANHLNDELSVNNDQGMFVTMFIGMANLHSGHLDFCNCGHNPPVLANQFMEIMPNAPIGLWPGLVFEGQQLDDIRGQRLFLYTDGLNEAEDNWQNQFSDKILLSLLIGHPGYDSEKTIQMFKHEVAEHVGTADPSDDLTMMFIKIQ